MQARLLWLLYLACSSMLYAGMAGATDVSVAISGVNKTLENALRSNLSLARQPNPQQATAASIRALYIRSLEEIGDVLRSYGHYDYQVTDSLRPEGEHWRAEFAIVPGPPVLIDALSIEITGEGGSDPELDKVVREFPLVKGAAFNHGRYESGKDRLEAIARERGYFDFQFVKHAVHIDRAGHTAAVDLVMDSGRRYRFGQAVIPPTVVEHDVLQRYVPFQTGTPYDANLLIEFGQNLRNSKYFDEAIVNASEEDAQDYHVPVHVSLTPRPRSDIRVGVGYGTDSGPRLVASWDNHYVNRRGHRIDSDLKLSSNDSEITGAYVMPNYRSNGAELDLVSSLSTEKTDTSISDAFRFGVRQNHMRWGWNETIGLTYRHESFKVADVGDTSNLLTPELNYWRTSSDSLIYTREGYRVNANLKGAVQGMLSNTSFLQLILSGKYIGSAGERNRWIARGDLGASYVPAFNELPASLRFFAGGDNSIRGFDVQQLGPVNEAGEVTGGKYLATGSLEYEMSLRGAWGMAVFTDFGNAFNDFSDHFVYSIGTGVRWKTPVGLLRVDIAAGISEDDVPFRLHINIGPDL